MTVHAMWVAMMLLILAVVIVQITAVIRLRHQVTTAADLAALAAARASSEGDDGCTAAREIARANHAELRDCRMDLDVATVSTRGQAGPWWGAGWTIEATARAAPAWYEQEE